MIKEKDQKDQRIYFLCVFVNFFGFVVVNTFLLNGLICLII